MKILEIIPQLSRGGGERFFLNWWLLPLPLPLEAVTGLYVLTIGTGYVCLPISIPYPKRNGFQDFHGGTMQPHLFLLDNESPSIRRD